MASAKGKWGKGDTIEIGWLFFWLVLDSGLRWLGDIGVPWLEGQGVMTTALAGVTVASIALLRRYLLDTRPVETVDSDGAKHTVSKV